MSITKEMLIRLQRPLDADEIEWKVNFAGKSASVNSTRIIPYIQVRAVQKRLRELGLENFQTQYTIIPKNQMSEGGMMCRLGLKFDEWVWFTEVAPESDIEPLKSAASSSLKRVANVIGISEDLYEYPIIYLPEPNLKSVPSYAYPQLEQLVKDFNEGLITEKFINIRNTGQQTTTPQTPQVNPISKTPFKK